MTYEASPYRPEFLRLVARLILCVGAIVAVWLITPTTASAALEPSTGLDDTVTDATADAGINVTDAAEEPAHTVTDAADLAVTSVTDAAQEPADTVTDAADPAVNSVTDAAEEPADTVTGSADVDGRADAATKAISSATRDVAGSARDAAVSVGDSADDAVATAENAGDGAADVGRQLQDADSAADLAPMSAAVEGTAEFVTPLVATIPRSDDDDGVAKSGGREDVERWRFGDEPAFMIRGPPVTSGHISAAATSDPMASAAASSGAPNTPPTSDGLPPAMGSTARDVLRDGSSFNDVTAILAAIMIALGLARWSWREAGLRYSSISLSLAERPG